MGCRRSTLNPDGGWTISTWSVSLPTILGGRDRDDVVVVTMATDTWQRIAHWLPYQNHSSSCDLIIHCSKSCMNLLEPLPNQQHTIKDKEESQDLECLNPAMTDMIHMMKKTNYSRSKQLRVFLYTESIANRNMGGDKCPVW